MKTQIKKIFSRNAILISLGYLVLVGALGYGFYEYKKLEAELAGSRNEAESLSGQLDESQTENRVLLEGIRNQQEIIDSFQGQISSISTTVGTLEKLSQTDPELLKKYSKVYFLNENYVPARLTEVGEQYAYENGTNYLIHADVWPFLRSLLESARADGVEILVASAFRSFDTQASLKSGYRVVYGSGANQFSADQGYSEHQLGTTVDFTSSKVGSVFSRFKDDPAYTWLADNAHKYGFTLSYPEGNSYYKAEPWHWRFVGRELAAYLHEEGKYFYDLDQREIDTYLVKLFD